MSVAVATSMALGLLIVLAAIMWRFGRQGNGPGPVARVLRWMTFAVTVGMAIAVFPAAWDDTGTFAVVLVGVPVLAVASAVVAHLTGRAVIVVSWVAAAVMLAWSLITALGLGFYFVAPSLLMTLVAAMSTRQAAESSSR